MLLVVGGCRPARLRALRKRAEADTRAFCATRLDLLIRWPALDGGGASSRAVQGGVKPPHSISSGCCSAASNWTCSVLESLENRSRPGFGWVASRESLGFSNA